MSKLRGFALLLVASSLLGPVLANAEPPSDAFRYVYDADGRLKAAIDPEGDTASYSWDAAGNLLSIDRDSSAKLSILQLSPAKGEVGETIEIEGTGFSETPASNTVKFNGTAATVEAATPWSLSVEVPAEATSGPVTVATPGEGPATSAQSFTVASSSKPTISSLSTTVAATGEEMTISGSNFDSSTSGNVVRLNGATALVTSATPTSVKFKVPPERLGGRVSITTPNGSTTGPDLFVPPNNAATSTVSATGRISWGESETMVIPTSQTSALILVDGVANQKISLVGSEASFSGTMKLLRPSGASIGGEPGFTKSAKAMMGPVTLPEAGTYTIQLTGSGAETGSVKLTAYTFEDVSGSITPTEEGATQSVSLTTPGQVARYSISGTAGQKVSIKTSSPAFPAGLAYYLEVLDPAGKSIGFNWWWGTSSGYWKVFELPSTGTYTLVVDGETSATGSVNLTLWDAPDITGGTIPPTTEGDSDTFSIKAAGQRNLVTIEGTKDQKISLVASEATFNGGMKLFRPSGAQLGGEPSISKSGKTMLGPVTLPEAGTYTIQLTGSGTETGSVKLTAHTFEDVSGSIAPTEEGAQQSVSLTTPGQVARYSITGTAGQKVSIKTSKPAFPASLAYYLELLDPTGKQIGFKWWWGTNSGYWQLLQLPSTGTYTLVVDGESTATGSVDLTVWDAPDITGGTITPTTEGESKTFQVKAAGQRNLVTFEGAKDQKISLVSSESSFSGTMKLLRPSGASMGEPGFTKTSKAVISGVALPEAGTYTIQLEGTGAEVGSTKLTAYNVEDISGSITPTEEGAKQSVSFSVPGQVARYSIAGTAGQKISIKRSNVAITGDGYYTQLYDPTGKQIDSIWQWGYQSGFWKVIQLPSTGTYTLLTKLEGPHTGSLDLTVWDAPDITGGTITPTTEGDSDTFSIKAAGQRSLVTMAGTASQLVTLKVTEPTFTGTMSTWTSGSSKVSGSEKSFSKEGSAKAEITLPATDTYTIRLEGSGEGTGSLKLTAYLGSHVAWLPPPGETPQLVSFSTERASGGSLAISYSDAGYLGSQDSTGTENGRSARSVADSGQGAADAQPEASVGDQSVGDSTPPAVQRHEVQESREETTGLSGLTSWTPKQRTWLPPEDSYERGWIAGRSSSPWLDLAALQASEGTSALSGQVLQVNGLPLKEAKVAIEGVSATTETDETGRFLLREVPSGKQVLTVDGELTEGSERFGAFKIGVDIASHETTELEAPIWLTPLDSAGDQHVETPTQREERITTDRIPGFEVRIPAGSRITDPEGRKVEDLNITAIPVDRPAFPLPPFLAVPVYFTVQPGGATFSKGAQVVYPNWGDLPPGKRVEFWNYKPDDGGWYVYGEGTVTDDGKQIMPDPGVRVWELTGAMVAGPPAPPGTGPNSDGASGGDPVDFYTGLFTYQKTDLKLADSIPLAIERTYRPQDSNSYSFGQGTTSIFDLRLWSTDTENEADLILPDGGRVHYVRNSPGGPFETEKSPGAFSSSTITWNQATGTWDLALANGTTFRFNPFNWAPLVAIRDRFGNTLTIKRGAGLPGNVTQVTTPHGRWAKFTYDGSNRVTEVADNGGRTVKYTYTSGRLTKVEAPDGRPTEYEYDGSGRMKAVVNARGNKYLQVVYDANGRVEKQTTGDGGVFEFDYDLSEAGKVEATTITDPIGNEREVEFNAEGFPVSETEAPGTALEQTTSFERQAETGLVLSETDPLGRKTEFEYDSSGNVTEVTRLAGTEDAVTSTFDYEPGTSNLTEATDPLGHATELEYGPNGELLKRTDALENETTLEYNGDGQPTSVTNPEEEETTISYDHGDLATITDPLGRTASQFTDALGRVRSITSPDGQRTLFSYNDADELTGITSPSGAQTSLGYDNDGNVTSIVDPRENETTLAYDVMDRPETETNPLEDAAERSYDKAGHLIEAVSGSGDVSKFSYDALGRLAKASFGVEGESAESTIEYEYDDADRLMGVVDSASGEYALGYDDLDRLTEISEPNGTVAYLYDAAGRREFMSLPGQEALEYEYDNANRLTGLSRPGEAVSLGYDDADRLTGLTLPNGLEQVYDHDEAGQTTSIVFKDGESTLGDLQYAYDANSRTKAIWGSYARLDLPEAMGSAKYNAANQLVERDEQELSYDKDGNLIEDDANEYEWDARGQLSGISGAASAAFSYDPFGRRISKTLGETTTGLLYDGVNVAQEYSGEELAATVLAGLQPDQLLSRTTGEGADSYLTDRLGSVIALADESGEVGTAYSYEPFGAASSTGASSDNPYQFTGRENDGTGLQFNRARYYSPASAGFISPDPAGFAGSGPNLYGYVDGNPLDFTDPSGECFPCIPSFNPVAPLEDAADQIGDWVSDAPGVISSVWATTGDYFVSCAGNGLWGAAFGAAVGAGAAGAGAVPGAIAGGLTGCGEGLVQQGLRDAGQDTAADVVDWATATRDVGKAAKDVGKEAPELPERLKDVWNIFF